MTEHFHIMGIGGLGMSAIAHLLLDQGNEVSGCDLQANVLTAELATRGARIEQGHSAAHLDHDVDTLVISSAVRPGAPEMEAAKQRGIPALKRAELWRRWSQEKPTLAVAGTHGKTTTTAMVALILSRLGYDPAFVVPAGGPVPGLPHFARWGTGPFVIEADEYDRLFLGLLPEVAIITNVDWDHVDIYPSPGDVDAVFAEFACQVRGTVIACGDDAGARRVRAMTSDGPAHWQMYGFDAAADWRVEAVAEQNGWTEWSLHTPEGHVANSSIRARLQVPGRHNVLNAAAAVAAVAHFGVAPEAAVEVLADFRGAARRFELKGEAEGVTFIDDYAHNPAKVAATLAAARSRYPHRRLVVYFQPHTFSRTAALLQSLAQAFAQADVVLVGDIYPSRERGEDFPGIDAALLARHIPGAHAQAVGGLEQATARLFDEVRSGDVVLTLGAGDGYKVGESVLRQLAAGGVSHGA